MLPIHSPWPSRWPKPSTDTTAVRRSGGIDPHLLAWGIGVLAYLLAMWLLAGRGLDFAIADRLYAWEGGRWALRQHWLTVSVIHAGGKALSIAAWLGLAAFTAVIWRHPGWHAWRRPLLALLGSVLISVSLVAAIKHAWSMDCPWSLQRYGGTEAFVGLFQARPDGMPAAGCFPSAHASSGFAWVALYFFLLQARPRWRWVGLAVGLVAGSVFAVSQQLRGAHFLSHDITTLLLCWTVALLLHRTLAARVDP